MWCVQRVDEVGGIHLREEDLLCVLNELRLSFLQDALATGRLRCPADRHTCKAVNECEATWEWVGDDAGHLR
jgi:hypothetical protein